MKQCIKPFFYLLLLSNLQNELKENKTGCRAWILNTPGSTKMHRDSCFCVIIIRLEHLSLSKTKEKSVFVEMARTSDQHYKHLQVCWLKYFTLFRFLAKNVVLLIFTSCSFIGHTCFVFEILFFTSHVKTSTSLLQDHITL